MKNEKKNIAPDINVGISKPSINLQDSFKTARNSSTRVCLQNNTITSQPISVNINISNSLVASKDTSPKEKKETVFGGKKSEIYKKLSQKFKGPISGYQKTDKEPPKLCISLSKMQSSLNSKTIEVYPQTYRNDHNLNAQTKAELGSNSISSTLTKVFSKNSAKKFNSITTERDKDDSFEDIKFPIPAAQLLKKIVKCLTDTEKEELLDYSMIYYIGKHLLNRMANGGQKWDLEYDDDKGDYNAYVGEHIAYRYEIIDLLGKGSFGQAIKCLDHKNNQIVALKVIRSKKRFYHQATVEVKILKYIRDNDTQGCSNVVNMLDYFIFRKHIVSKG